MLKTGLLNPQLASLLRRVRHTNTVVVADRGFPSWPGLETIDLSLVDGVPTILQVVAALTAEFQFGVGWMAAEFLEHNDAPTRDAFAAALGGIPIHHEPHVDFKKRVPNAVGLIRTGDTTQYANLILESA
ncbi:D-ribose pyranase [Botrimarina colliarenosi]|uniref:D-ribose pyranase n=1 Tax=Botrimarina colliarenosi TaxID=2528001 RepID=A0A5C6AEH8_9BACT|nr:RbsD/FucU family protein [Botrimarina colliarenosi]TWT97718.1 D-ribose pyranase [Botrimarina colliarenosi]